MVGRNGKAADGIMARTTFVHDACAYLLAAGLSGLLLIPVLRLHKAHLSVPASDLSDALITSMWIKSTLTNGWYLHNPDVGMPTGLDYHDFPQADALNFLFIKLLSLVSRDHAVVGNLYFFLTFPLTALSSLFALRRFGLSRGSALLVSLLFAFLPYHFIKGTGPLLLANYCLVPLVVLLALRLYEDDKFSLGAKKFPLSWQGVGAVMVCLLTSSAGVYYAFFACFLLLVAGMAASLSAGHVRPLTRAGILVGCIAAGTAANLAPTFLYQYRHGPNASAIVRSPAEAEMYGVKIAQLLLPITHHRVGLLADLKERYNAYCNPNHAENDAASLGVIASAGFLVLVTHFLFRRRMTAVPLAGASGSYVTDKPGQTSLKSKASELPLAGASGWYVRDRGGQTRLTRKRSAFRLLDGLGILNASAFFLTTVGGFGALFSVCVTAWIRSYSRISVYLAFLSLFAVAIVLDRLAWRWCAGRKGALAWAGILATLLAAGILDQTSRAYVPDYARLRKAYRQDAAFVAAIEKRLPAGAMIFQLPYVAFPEYPAVHELNDYELFRGYLHSKRLRWSYGAIKGRSGDQWQKTVAVQPLAEMLRTLALAGFSGVYVDRRGYSDGASALETGLAHLLATDPLVSADGTRVFFDMTPYIERLQSSPAEWSLGAHEARGERRGRSARGPHPSPLSLAPRPSPLAFIQADRNARVASPPISSTASRIALGKKLAPRNLSGSEASDRTAAALPKRPMPISQARRPTRAPLTAARNGGRTPCRAMAPSS
jgi:phosphoglycerol transferase